MEAPSARTERVQDFFVESRYSFRRKGECRLVSAPAHHYKTYRGLDIVPGP